MTPSKVVGDLQIGDKKVTLNHLALEISQKALHLGRIIAGLTAAFLGADHAATVEKSHEDGSQSGLGHHFIFLTTKPAHIIYMEHLPRPSVWV